MNILKIKINHGSHSSKTTIQFALIPSECFEIGLGIRSPAFCILLNSQVLWNQQNVSTK